MQLGFIGLGAMGAPMALNLVRAGHTVTVHRLTACTAHLASAGARPAGSAREVAEQAEIVITMLPDTPDVVSVLLGPDGVLAGLRPGSVVMDMSSISPVETRSLAERVHAAGSSYVDAPVSGGDVGARDGTLTIFVGGEGETVERVRPLLEVMGTTITHMGGVGAGQTTKVANQIIVALTIEAVAEGLAMADAAGIDLPTVRAALSGGFASSRVLELHGQRMIGEDFEPGFRLRLHRKDLHLASAAAEHYGIDAPGTTAVLSQMTQAGDRGWDDLDHAVLYRLSRGRSR